MVRNNSLAERRVDSDLTIDPEAATALASGRVGDPFSLLGPQPDGRGGSIVRAYVPPAESVELVDAQEQVIASMEPIEPAGLFAVRLAARTSYRLRIRWPGGSTQVMEDPYSFGLLLGELDVYLLAEGNHLELGRCLGAQAMSIDGVTGVRFAVWAPNARRVSVVGDFNGWDGRRHLMRKRVEAGVWELFIPGLPVGAVYKYEILGPYGLLPLKSDPVALQVEPPPRTASIVADPEPFSWTDDAWLKARAASGQHLHAPISIYEVHAGSWRRRWHDGQPLDWDELADQLIPYVKELQFTHVELLPIMAHPFGGSWGYQVLGQFAPHAAFGDPRAFARFVDRCHNAGLGVILDWVPGHFPTDTHGLAYFDGTPLYEHADAREGFHQEWNTAVYNLGRREVHSFLISSALHWIERYHADGLRVDAVASLLYRDYARKEGQWIPNRFGGRENLEAIDFLRHLNDAIAERFPGAMTLAEESTSWPGVTRPSREWGLGFTYKWNMGWMHDTLRYMQHDPVHRAYDHSDLTFGLLYAFSEHFVLPLSHDEVVHGKGSLIGRMPGDTWQKFANLRAYFAFMWTQPGKKLLFMGGEIGQDWEWDHDRAVDWPALDHPLHRGVQHLVRDLNHLYRTEAALHALDCDSAGFRWIVGDDRDNSVFAWYRNGFDGTPPVIVVCNFTPVPRQRYRIGAPRAGGWREILNTDAEIYGGSNMGNAGWVEAGSTPSHGQPFSLEITLPPLAAVLLRHGP
jgi:1,4-alpha-glucan branching enzyme